MNNQVQLSQATRQPPSKYLEKNEVSPSLLRSKPGSSNCCTRAIWSTSAILAFPRISGRSTTWTPSTSPPWSPPSRRSSTPSSTQTPTRTPAPWTSSSTHWQRMTQLYDRLYFHQYSHRSTTFIALAISPLSIAIGPLSGWDSSGP